eukprot:jgi/Botrbrau1/18889/Bobra.177_2s0047.1
MVCRHMQKNHQFCWSGEHYVPTVLAYWHMENETTCGGSVTWKDWEHGHAGHPTEFLAENITSGLIDKARSDPYHECKAEAAIRLTGSQFVLASAVQTDLCSVQDSWRDKLLGPSCPLFARKFKSHAAPAVYSLLSNCTNQLSIIGCEYSQPMTSQYHRALTHTRM